MEKNHFLQLVTRKFSGNISEEEELLLQNELHSNEEYRMEYTYLVDFWNEKKMLPAEVQLQLAKVWSAIEKKERTNPATSATIHTNHVHTFKKLLKIAAVLIPFFAGAFYLFTVLHPKKPVFFVKVLPVVSKQTSDTSRSYLMLPDGTKVWLNRSSTITYNENFGRAKREITLSGEAFFDVVKNEKVPLVIHAHNINITVRGTAFNVCAYARDRFIETSLIRGLVEVTDRSNPGKTILLKPNEKLTVARVPTDSLLNSRDTVFNSSLQPASYIMEPLNNDPSTNILPETAWLKNKLVFYKTSFEAVAAKMESWYGVTISIENDSLRSQKFSGVFEQETLEQALSALQLSYPFQYVIHHKKVTITK